jgi:Zn-dependent protease with chaperone function
MLTRFLERFSGFWSVEAELEVLNSSVVNAFNVCNVFKCLVIVFKGLIDVLCVNEIRAVIANGLGHFMAESKAVLYLQVALGFLDACRHLSYVSTTLHDTVASAAIAAIAILALAALLDMSITKLKEYLADIIAVELT